MSINVSEESTGSYTLRTEMWCDGDTVLKNHVNNENLTHPIDAFEELCKLESKLEVVADRIDGFLTCFAGVDADTEEFLEELKEWVKDA